MYRETRGQLLMRLGRYDEAVVTWSTHSMA